MVPIAAFKACPLFKGFTAAGLQILAEIAVERKVREGVPLFVENMVSESLIVLAQGRVKLTAKNRAGEQAAVGEVGPGDYLGEISLIRPGHRMCTATALSEVSAVEIRHVDFQKLLASKPLACVKLLMGIFSLFGEKLNDNRENLRVLLEKN